MELSNSPKLSKFLHDSLKYKQIMCFFNILISNKYSELTHEIRPSSTCGHINNTFTTVLMVVFFVINYLFPRREYYLCEYFYKKYFYKKILELIQTLSIQNRGQLYDRLCK